MAASKKKQVRQPLVIDNNYAIHQENPDSFYSSYPSWNFKLCDSQKWPFSEDGVGELFWDEIFPHLQSLERQSWSEILIQSKKQNHAIYVNTLNKNAIDRLQQLHIEEEAIYSLRVTAKHRIYGLVDNGVFFVIWYDNDHGDNDHCVCRSRKKHT